MSVINAFQVLLSVEFYFILKSRSSNSYVICGQKNIPPFILASVILEIFCQKWAKPSLPLSIAFTHIFFLSKPALCLMEANRFLTYPLNQGVPHSTNLEMFLNGVAIFLFCSGSPPFGCPFRIKAAEFSVSALQHTQHC